MAVRAAEFELELVVGVQGAVAGEVSDHEGVVAGSEDETGGRVVAAALEYGGLHAGQYILLWSTRFCEALGGSEGVVGQGGGLADVFQLGVALDQTKAADEMGAILVLAAAVDGGADIFPTRAGEAVGVQFYAQALAATTLLLEDLPEIEAGVDVGAVNPDADVVDDRGQAGLAEVGGTGQEDQVAVGAEVEALELGVAGGVVAGEVVHAFLPEDQEGGQIPSVQFRHNVLPAAGQLLLGEVHWHFDASNCCGYGNRTGAGVMIRRF